eukprot:TRINITY_DN9181_c0_g1_i1.p1 TRINITY_DN9181_c0_g1~~TRINITY_DN9181_c0_g1_i1.p1  ORF type:complete len:107 (+),score=26.29 TRINITY_DN9181_c0_g1_i1:91-411(+)
MMRSKNLAKCGSPARAQQQGKPTKKGKQGKMPKELKDLKQFLDVCSRSDAKKVKVKKNAENTKFKVRCSRFLYTLVVKDPRKAAKIQGSIHTSVAQEVIGKGKASK